jgi:hypothetical protein
MSEARRVFLQSRYRADLALRASRYKAVLMLEICFGIVIKLTVLERSGFSQGAGNCLGSSGKPAKTVSSLLIIPSVLYVVFYSFLKGRDLLNRFCYLNKTKLSLELNASELNSGITI